MRFLRDWLILVCLLLVPWVVAAAPQAQPGDPGLRHDIQVLADYGALSGPVTTWPISWDAVLHDLERVETGDVVLPNRVIPTYERVLAKARRETEEEEVLREEEERRAVTRKTIKNEEEERGARRRQLLAAAWAKVKSVAASSRARAAALATERARAEAERARAEAAAAAEAARAARRRLEHIRTRLEGSDER